MGGYMMYGYVINDKWVLQWGLNQGLGTNETYEATESTIVCAASDIMNKSGISGRSKFAGVKFNGKTASCFALATNDPRDGMPVPPPEKWQKLKEILNTSKEPKWYPYA